ncbi:MAG: T9SS type A sorting domain-containing protein, partial [Ignavibacteria bacterium]|nr:T9SS type A sorting domain-containing protein [Ignavibacteria bacterium]
AQLSGGGGGTVLNLVYDDGTPAGGYYWSSANTGSCNRMTPTVSSAQVIQMGIYFTGINAGSGNYKPIILGKSAGKPGSNLATLPTRIASPPGWDDFDLTSYNITVTDEFFVGLLYDGVNRPAFGFDPANNGRAWDKDTSGNWTAWNETYFMRAKIKTTTSIAELDNKIPKDFSISQNFPNPFNPQTKIKYSLPKGEYVKIKVFDVNGKEVAELVNNYQSPGNYTVEWNGRNNFGQQVSSGIYFYQIEAGKYKETKKMTLIK